MNLNNNSTTPGSIRSAECTVMQECLIDNYRYRLNRLSQTFRGKENKGFEKGVLFGIELKLSLIHERRKTPSLLLPPLPC